MELRSVIITIAIITLKSEQNSVVTVPGTVPYSTRLYSTPCQPGPGSGWHSAAAACPCPAGARGLAKLAGAGPRLAARAWAHQVVGLEFEPYGRDFDSPATPAQPRGRAAPPGGTAGRRHVRRRFMAILSSTGFVLDCSDLVEHALALRPSSQGPGGCSLRHVVVAPGSVGAFAASTFP
eukprot:423814-Hanusia_phi.AAC.1